MEGVPQVRPQKLNRLKKDFYRYDINGDGTVDRLELYASVRMMGGKIPREELDNMINEIAPDGRISLPAFLQMFGLRAVVESLKQKFMKASKTKDGRLTTQEFRGLVGYDQVRELFFISGKKLGEDLSFDEFVAFMLFKAPLRKVDRRSVIPNAERIPIAAIKRMRNSFFEMDTNGNGMLSSSELQQVLRKAGIKLTPNQVDSLIEQVDLDENGELNLLEFLVLLGHSAEISLYWEAFKSLDTDKSGTLSREEMAKGVKSMEIEHPKREVKRFFKELGIKEVTFDRFVEYMVRLDSKNHELEDEDEEEFEYEYDDEYDDEYDEEDDGRH